MSKTETGPVALPEHETPEMHDAVMSVLYQGVTRQGTDELWQAYRRALLAAHPPAQEQPTPAVPQGWKLVPVSPTQEMHDAARAALASGSIPMPQVYRAMLAAAPTHPTPAERAEQPRDVQQAIEALQSCADILRHEGVWPGAEKRARAALATLKNQPQP